MSLIGLALAAIELATELAKRAHQSGELNDTQKQMLRDKARAMFAAFSGAAPPPPEGHPV